MEAKSSSSALLALLMIMVGCIGNNYFLEYFIRYDRNGGAAITLFSFLFMAVEGGVRLLRVSPGHWLPRLAPRQIPLRSYAVLTTAFVGLSLLNNYAFVFHVSVPVHTVVRASSLIASIAVGRVFFDRTYSGAQTVGAIVVTAGIAVVVSADHAAKSAAAAASTSATATQCATCDGQSPEPPAAAGGAHGLGPMQEWVAGMAVLFAAMLASAVLGHLQQRAYEAHAADRAAAAQESKFYSHALALPYFFLLSGSVAEHVAFWGATPPLALPAILGGGTLPIPTAWALVAALTLTQSLCISGVYLLTAVTSTLTCTLAITLRKFATLVLSVVLFDNLFTPAHWLGSVLVFVGVFVYSGVIPLPAPKEKGE